MKHAFANPPDSGAEWHRPAVTLIAVLWPTSNTEEFRWSTASLTQAHCTSVTVTMCWSERLLERVKVSTSWQTQSQRSGEQSDFLTLFLSSFIVSASGSWSHSEPKCVYKWCGQLGALPNGHLTVTNRTVDGVAMYTCNGGHKLIGVRERRCLLGGRWTGEEPLCKYIDCGLPIQPQHGRHRLLGDATTYESKIVYECDLNHTLIGNATRVCTEMGTWSGVEPTCKRKSSWAFRFKFSFINFNLKISTN